MKPPARFLLPECFLLLQLLLILLHNAPVQAWGTIGHEVIANLAWHRLDPATQSRLSHILKLRQNSNTTLSPLAQVANWADHVRYTHAYHWSAPLHYVDVQDNDISGGCPVVPPGEISGCYFVYPRDCRHNVCAAGAIANYSTLLWAPSLGNDQNDSLKFVTHFVGDIHQPLHSSRKSDMGGNSIHVHFQDSALSEQNTTVHPPHEKWNLHSIWDAGMLEKALHEFYDNDVSLLEQELVEMIQEYEKTGQIALILACSDGRHTECTSIWAEESLEYALSWAYRDVNGLEIQDGSHISETYFTSRLEIVKNRLMAAGVRLARTLELSVPRQESHHPSSINPTESSTMYLRGS